MVALVLIEWRFKDDPSEVYQRWIAGEGSSKRLAREDAVRFAEEYLVSSDDTVLKVLHVHKTTARDADVMAGACRAAHSQARGET